MLTQKLLAHLPLLLHPNPRQVGIVGLGSGVTLASALVHPVVSVDVVEISPEVVEASAHFADVNRRALDDPRTRLVRGDGRTHLSLTSRRYDVVISEPSNPWMAGVAALFTQEFFRTVREPARTRRHLLSVGAHLRRQRRRSPVHRRDVSRGVSRWHDVARRRRRPPARRLDGAARAAAGDTSPRPGSGPAWRGPSHRRNAGALRAALALRRRTRRDVAIRGGRHCPDGRSDGARVLRTVRRLRRRPGQSRRHASCAARRGAQAAGRRARADGRDRRAMARPRRDADGRRSCRRPRIATTRRPSTWARPTRPRSTGSCVRPPRRVRRTMPSGGCGR